MAPSPPSAPAPSRPKLGEFLIRAGFINQDQMRQALHEQRNSNHSLGRVLVDMGFVTEQIRIQALRQSYHYELVDLSHIKVDPFVATLIPLGVAQSQRIFPLRREKDKLVVAMEDPSDEITLEAIRLQSGLEIKPYIITKLELDGLLNVGQSKRPGAPAISIEGGGRNRESLHRWSFRFLVLLPLLVFLGLIRYNADFQDFLLTSGQTFFDLGMYTGLGLGLWAVVVYEITGIIFKSDEED